MRIAIGGITHEAITFTPIKTTVADFRVWRGDDVLAYPGLSAAAADLRFEPVPTLVAGAWCPGGVVTFDAYHALRDEMLDRLHAAGPVDGVCLILHGAMLVEDIGSGETDQVRAVRAIVGPDVPIAARLDPHANLTDEFVRLTDTWAVFRTIPHADQPQTLHRTLRLLVEGLRAGRRPRPAFVRLPLLLPGEKATVAVEPMKSLLARAIALEGRAGIRNAEVLVGFGWADAPHAGSSVVVVADGEAHLDLARREARALAADMWSQRAAFTFDQEVAESADEAIDIAMSAPEGTVFISDSGDNPTAGATGDVPLFLSRLLARHVPDAVLTIVDADAVATCAEAGVGASVTLSVGGKLDREHGEPVTLSGVVDHLYRAQPDEVAASTATVRAGGVRVILQDRRVAFRSLDDFDRAGIDALSHKIVVVKLGYLMAGLRAVAPREVLALTPGYADMDFHRLPYRHVTRPIYPLDGDFAWSPAADVAGGIAP